VLGLRNTVWLSTDCVCNIFVKTVTSSSWLQILSELLKHSFDEVRHCLHMPILFSFKCHLKQITVGLYFWLSATTNTEEMRRIKTATSE
jgi:hypothetical protein